MRADLVGDRAAALDHELALGVEAQVRQQVRLVAVSEDVTRAQDQRTGGGEQRLDFGVHLR